jgi:TRAP-type C4-dicarboxylate transport system substrate-binding protein
MTDINEITNGLMTMDHDYYDRLTSDERIQVLESIMIWAKWEINSVQRHKEQAQEEFNKHMGLNQ